MCVFLCSLDAGEVPPVLKSIADNSKMDEKLDPLAFHW